MGRPFSGFGIHVRMGPSVLSAQKCETPLNDRFWFALEQRCAGLLRACWQATLERCVKRWKRKTRRARKKRRKKEREKALAIKIFKSRFLLRWWRRAAPLRRSRQVADAFATLTVRHRAGQMLRTWRVWA